MKRQMMPPVPGPGDDDGCPADMSAEAALQGEIAELGGWLAAQGFNPWGDHAHAHEGSRDQFYWRYGYFMGLNQALAMLTTRGATVH